MHSCSLSPSLLVTVKVCSHLTFAFPSKSLSKHYVKGNANTNAQNGYVPFHAFDGDVDANANVKCEHTLKYYSAGFKGNL